MKNLVSLRGVATALVAVAVLVGPAFAADQVTVGDFYKKVADIQGVEYTDAAGAEAALRAVGMRAPVLDLGKILTQGDVASIANAAGLRVTTSTPDATFTEDQLSLFVSSFGTELGPIGGIGGEDMSTDALPWENGADPLTKGKGLKKGLYKRISPSEPL